MPLFPSVDHYLKSCSLWRRTISNGSVPSRVTSRSLQRPTFVSELISGVTKGIIWRNLFHSVKIFDDGYLIHDHLLLASRISFSDEGLGLHDVLT